MKKQPSVSSLTLVQYHAFSKLLHWLMAVLIVAMLTLGLLLGEVPEEYRKLAFGIHKSTGVLLLALAFVRLGWRFVKPAPSLPAEFPLWVRGAARVSHYTLYTFLFMMPLTGWLMSNTAGRLVTFYDLFTLPTLMGEDPILKDVFNAAHEWIGYGLITVIVIHASAALWHHFIRKDATLRRMLPQLK